MAIPTFFESNLQGTLGMLKMHLADMTDAELMQRPVAGANHGNWQLGHLIVSELNLTTKAGAPGVELPAGFAERYSKETANIDDPSKFATKAELLAQYERVRTATIGWVKTLTPAQLDAPSPVFPQLLPTVGHIANFGSMHLLMHIGQIQVLRRKLGKPVLF